MNMDREVVYGENRKSKKEEKVKREKLQTSWENTQNSIA